MKVEGKDRELWNNQGMVTSQAYTPAERHNVFPWPWYTCSMPNTPALCLLEEMQGEE